MATRRTAEVRTLTIDIGGSGIKAAVLDPNGRRIADRLRVATPVGATPRRFVTAIVALVAPLRPFDRVSVGFPGVVRAGVVRTAANLGNPRWIGFDLEAALTTPLRVPVRVRNDADLAGLGAIQGHGVEMVVTLGTGVGSGIYEDGRLGPHLELGHHPFRKGKTYEECLGDAALRTRGKRKWRDDLVRAIGHWRDLLHFDRLFLGGGNARHAAVDGVSDIVVVTNEAALVGGVALWSDVRSTVRARRKAVAARAPRRR